MHVGNSLSMDQLEDEIVSTRVAVFKEYLLKGLVSQKDMTVSINCLDVDCKGIERCCFGDSPTIAKHFEIPALLGDRESIIYIGPSDRSEQFIIYYGSEFINWNKYRKRGANKPYVYVDPTPNNNRMLDCFVFGAPLINQICAVIAIKDFRQLEPWSCCLDLEEMQGNSLVEDEVRRRLTQEKLQYYRQLAPNAAPNDQAYK